MSEPRSAREGDDAALAQRLSASEAEVAQLRALLDSAPSGICVLEGPDLRCTFANRALTRLTEGRFGVGHSARATLSAPGAPPFLEVFDRVLATGEAESVEAVPAPLPDGRPRFLTVRATPLLGTDGAIRGITSFVTDVTSEVRSRARTRSLLAVATAFSEALTPEDVARVVVERIHEAAVASATVLYFVPEEGGPARLVGHRGIPPEMAAHRATLPPSADVPLNDAMRTHEPVWLVDRAEILARYPSVARTSMPQSDLQAMVALPIRLGSRVLGGIGMSFAQSREFDTAKREFLLSVASECALALERASLFQRVVRDEQEQRRTAEILRFLVDASDALGRSLDVESAFQALVEVAVPRMADWAVVDLPGDDRAVRMVAVAHSDPAKVALAHELRRRYPPTQDDPQGVGRVLRTGDPEIVKDIPDELLVAAIPDPELLGIMRELGLASALTLPIEARGATVGALTLIAAESRRRFDDADVTVATEVARRAGIALDHARAFREAQEANRLKDEFLGTVSHELRTPLNAILGWVTLLRGKKSGDAASLTRGLDTIERNARAQARLIEDVLDVSRIISGKLLVRRELVDGEAVLRAALEIIAPMAAGKGVTIESAIEPGVMLVGDPDRLQQVAWNLLSNAVKFTPSGGVVRVALAREGSAAVLRVSDTGAGIPADLLPFVFDRFRQADSSPSRRHGGLGLGLAIARHLVELHGGTVVAESPGERQGSTFTVTLPIRAVQVREEPSSARPPEQAGAVTAEPSLAGVRALVCDDDDDARELVHEVLTGAGAEVRATSSAVEALAALGDARPDVLVSDIGMPGEDGYHLVRAVRGLSPEEGGATPAIALTAYARRSDAEKALEAGFQVHLAKPIRERELIDAVARLVGRGPVAAP